MFQSSAFDYINVLDKAADASWLRESTLANNIANATTPDFKRYDVDFQSLLERELMDTKFNRNLDEKIHNMNLDRLTATSQIDMAAESYSYRLDGNNVDMHTENVELASEQIRYKGITDSITQEFSRMRTAMGK
ncbi:Flagellar basal body rod protein FlgB [Eubacterium plexicaudatum ASF492]|uniref:Flagellar basal body rod protein FlgB n=1 Tax=Eubacterium plexicaudatum ASF492 TaxID=1235802 RepID=N2BQ45_9FIRM|nr:Flagellar basal body rod protein FlgB [Eubacterium plexicaudatum ASF492]